MSWLKKTWNLVKIDDVTNDPNFSAKDCLSHPVFDDVLWAFIFDNLNIILRGLSKKSSDDMVLINAWMNNCGTCAHTSMENIIYIYKLKPKSWLANNNFFKISTVDKCMISYIPKKNWNNSWFYEKKFLMDESGWKSPSLLYGTVFTAHRSVYCDNADKYRIRMNPGRFFRKIFPWMSDENIHKLVQELVGLTANVGIEISDDISWTYKSKNYYSQKGNLGNSCMRHAPKEAMEFYENSGVQVARILKEGKVTARAIFWPKVLVLNPTNDMPKFLPMVDRVYTNNYLHVSCFQKWAEQNGYLFRLSEGCFEYKGEEYNLQLEMEVDNTNCGEMPYFDTMRCIYIRNKAWIINNYYKGDECSEEFIGASDIVEDYWTGNHYPERDMVWCEYAGGYTHHQNAVELVDGTYLNCEDENTFHINNIYVYVDDVVTAYDGTDLIPPEYDSNTVKLYNGEWANLKLHDIIELDTGEYATTDDDNLIWNEVEEVYYIESEKQKKVKY